MNRRRRNEGIRFMETLTVVVKDNIHLLSNPFKARKRMGKFEKSQFCLYE
jgi:hypothetical protein